MLGPVNPMELRDSLPKSGPLDLASKYMEKLYYAYTKIAIFVFKFLILAPLQAKSELSPFRPLRDCFKD